MATGLTLAGLRTLLRNYIDDSGSDRFTDGECNTFLNIGQQEVQKVIDDADENFFSACQSYTVVPSPDSLEFELPDNFKKAILAERLVTDGVPTSGEYIEFRRRHQERYASVQDPLNNGVISEAPLYYLRGTKIGVVSPSQSYTMRLWYTYAIPDLVNDTDYSEIPVEYRNLIAISAVPFTKGERVGPSGAMPEELEREYLEGLSKLRMFIQDRHRQKSRQVVYYPE